MRYYGNAFHAVLKRTDGTVREIVFNKDFRLDVARMLNEFFNSLNGRCTDLLRIAIAVYAVDRLEKRPKSHRRVLPVDIEVADPSFWNSEPVNALLQETVNHVSGGDMWHFSFKKCEPCHCEPTLFPWEGIDRVCLYSGGLDSAAGLANQLRVTKDSMLAVSVLHRANLKGVIDDQLKQIKGVCGNRVHSLMLKASLINSPRMKYQELSQRCRSFLFAAVGGVAGIGAGLNKVEVFENGVGILNLPPMVGMTNGSRATRSCHPYFLKNMGDLLSMVANRPFEFALPFAKQTKGEVLTNLKGSPFETLLRESVSCVHFPLREKGAKQCGVCPGCLERRQAFLVSGIEEKEHAYKSDVFTNALLANSLADQDLEYLRNIQFQVLDLSEVETHGLLSPRLRLHIEQSKADRSNLAMGEFCKVLVRYRYEWLRVIGEAQKRGFTWSKLIKLPNAA